MVKNWKKRIIDPLMEEIDALIYVEPDSDSAFPIAPTVENVIFDNAPLGFSFL